MGNDFSIIRKPQQRISSGFAGSDNLDDNEMAKSHVHSYTKTTKSGKVVRVRDYSDSRMKRFAKENNLDPEHPNTINAFKKTSSHTKSQAYKDSLMAQGKKSDMSSKKKSEEYKKRESTKGVPRTFDRDDWSTFSGSESFSDGSSPLISDIDFEETSATVVGDKSTITVMTGKYDMTEEFVFTLPPTIADKQKLVKNLMERMFSGDNNEVDFKYLEGWGFVKADMINYIR